MIITTQSYPANKNGIVKTGFATAINKLTVFPKINFSLAMIKELNTQFIT